MWQLNISTNETMARVQNQRGWDARTILDAHIVSVIHRIRTEECMQNVTTFQDDRKAEGGYGRRAPFGEPLTSAGYSSFLYPETRNPCRLGNRGSTGSGD